MPSMSFLPAQVQKLHNEQRQRQLPNQHRRQRMHSGRSSSSASMCGGYMARCHTCCQAARLRLRFGTPPRMAMSGAHTKHRYVFMPLQPE